MSDRDAAATVQFKLRMRESLRAKIEEWADIHRVSMNTEIVDRLEKSFGEAVALKMYLDTAMLQWGEANTRAALMNEIARDILDALKSLSPDKYDAIRYQIGTRRFDGFLKDIEPPNIIVESIPTSKGD